MTKSSTLRGFLPVFCGFVKYRGYFIGLLMRVIDPYQPLDYTARALSLSDKKQAISVELGVPTTMQTAANNALSHTLRKVLGLQAALVTITAVALALLKGHEFFLATLYGGAIIIASTGYFGWRLGIATQTHGNEPAVNSVALFKSIFIRFVLVIGLLALGLGSLKLAPAGVLSGFIVAQLAFWFSRSSYGVTRRR